MNERKRIGYSEEKARQTADVYTKVVAIFPKASSKCPFNK
jgi:hypothetical protein